MKRLLKNAFFFSMVLAVSILAFGCSMVEPRPVIQEGLRDVQPGELLKKNIATRSPGPPPFSEKLVPAEKDLSGETRLFTLFFDGVPLGEVLGALTEDMELNLALESDIDLKRPVTVHLKNVTFEEALEMVVVKGVDYAWKIEEGCLEIKRFEERIYHLDYLDMVKDTDIEVGGDMLSSAVDQAGVIAKYQVKGKRSGAETDVWANVEKVLKGLKSGEGTIRITRSAGIIYMADSPRKIASMVRFLDTLSESLHRQVLIEARIFEVALSDEYQYGIDWKTLQITYKASDAFLDFMSMYLNSAGAILMADRSGVELAVDFLRTQGDLTVLSNPHLSVMNGQSALMTVGYQFPYGDISGVDRDTESRLITYGSAIKRAILGLQLGITPQIAADGMITLHIVPTITNIQGMEDVEIPVGTAVSQTISNPIITLQEIATTVRVRDGHSVVLAGLITQVRKQEYEGVPWLGSIPWIGRLFQHVEDTAENKELVILITPHIKEAG